MVGMPDLSQLDENKDSTIGMWEPMLSGHQTEWLGAIGRTNHKWTSGIFLRYSSVGHLVLMKEKQIIWFWNPCRWSQCECGGICWMSQHYPFLWSFGAFCWYLWGSRRSGIYSNAPCSKPARWVLDLTTFLQCEFNNWYLIYLLFERAKLGVKEASCPWRSRSNCDSIYIRMCPLLSKDDLDAWSAKKKEEQTNEYCNDFSILVSMIVRAADLRTRSILRTRWGC